MASDLNATLMKNRFYELLDSYRRSRPPRGEVSISDHRYKQIIEDIEIAKSKSRKSDHEIWLLKTYEVVNVNGINKLICPSKGSQKLFYVSDGELFDVLHKVHNKIGHVVQSRMGTVLRKQYLNVTKNVIDLYIELCKECQQKSVKPILTPKYKPRAETTLIDLQFKPDGDYNFILVYQDDITKFITLKPLKTDQLNEVVHNLFEIFSTFSPPAVLRYYNNTEFIKNILAHLKERWPKLKMVYDEYKYTNDRENIVNLIKDLKMKLLDWMEQHNNQQWSIGLPFIQSDMNKSHNVQNPYKTPFGRTKRLGVKLKDSENICTQNLVKTKNANKPKKPYKPPVLESVRNKILVPKLKTKKITSKKRVKKSRLSKPITNNNAVASTVSTSNSSIAESITNYDPSSESIIIDSLKSPELNDTFTVLDAIIDIIPSDSNMDDLSSSEFVKDFLSAPVIEVSASESAIEFNPDSYPLITIPPASTLDYTPNPSNPAIDLSEFNLESYNTLPQAGSSFGNICNSETFNPNPESSTIFPISEANIITPETIFESITSSESMFDSLPLTESIDDSLPIPESIIEDFHIIFK